MTDEQIFFLISQPRSGSTMLQAILGSHPEIHTSSEPWIALPFIYPMMTGGSEFDFNHSWSRNAIKDFFKVSGIKEDFFNTTLNTFLTALYKKALEGSGKSIFLDKTPRYYEIASELIKVFPKAKFIVLYRHPLSVLHSILSTWVIEDIDKLFYFSRDLLVAPEKLIDFVSDNHENICLTRYEDLVRSPAIEIERICKYFGIEYLEETINYKAQTNWAYGDKKFLDQKTPTEKSVDIWKRMLGNKRRANFSYYYLNDLGEEVFDSLGYDFSAALSYVKKFNPNKDDFNAWKTLLNDHHVISVEEQRLMAKRRIKGKSFNNLLEKLMS